MPFAGSKPTHSSSGASARRLFSRCTWVCCICGTERPDEQIASEFYDIGQKLGVRSGIVMVNIRYCKDNSECEHRAKNFYGVEDLAG